MISFPFCKLVLQYDACVERTRGLCELTGRQLHSREFILVLAGAKNRRIKNLSLKSIKLIYKNGIRRQEIQDDFLREL